MAIKCEEYMQDAPYKWCCKMVCMEKNFAEVVKRSARE